MSVSDEVSIPWRYEHTFGIQLDDMISFLRATGGDSFQTYAIVYVEEEDFTIVCHLGL